MEANVQTAIATSQKQWWRAGKPRIAKKDMQLNLVESCFTAAPLHFHLNHRHRSAVIQTIVLVVQKVWHQRVQWGYQI